MARPPPDEPGSRSRLAFPLLAFPLPASAPGAVAAVAEAAGERPLRSGGNPGISLRLASRALSAGGAPSTGDDLSAASASSCLTDLRQIPRM